jgi:hypothetical protein
MLRLLETPGDGCSEKRYSSVSSWRPLVTQRLLSLTQAAHILGIIYPTLKQWIYGHQIRTVKTPDGHDRVPESEI